MKSRKKGLFLPEVLLSVIVIGMVIVSLLVFFNEMNDKEGDEAVLAMMIGDINQELYYYGAMGGGTTGIDLNTNLVNHEGPNGLLMFKELNEKANEIGSKMAADIPTYTFNSGLKISFNPNILSCVRLLKFDLGFLNISQDGSSFRPRDDIFKTVISRKNYCASLKTGSRGSKYFYLKN